MDVILRLLRPSKAIDETIEERVEYRQRVQSCWLDSTLLILKLPLSACPLRYLFCRLPGLSPS